MNKGQAATEAMFSMAIILLIFLLFFSIIVNHDERVRDYEGNWEEAARCKKIAGIMSALYVAGNGAKWDGTIDRNLFVYGDSFIDLEDYNATGAKEGALCYFDGVTTEDVNGHWGDIEIMNIDGNIVVRNA
ncbi:MAG: hypothetical protein ABIE23_06205 [archaeon]